MPESKQSSANTVAAGRVFQWCSVTWAIHTTVEIQKQNFRNTLYMNQICRKNYSILYKEQTKQDVTILLCYTIYTMCSTLCIYMYLLFTRTHTHTHTQLHPLHSSNLQIRILLYLQLQLYWLVYQSYLSLSPGMSVCLSIQLFIPVHWQQVL